MALYEKGEHEQAFALVKQGVEAGEIKGEAACRFFLDAAVGKNRVARYEAGRCAAHGIGMGRDAELAFDWYSMAAEQGYVPAMAALGGLFFAGRGIKTDDAEGIRWYRRAAEQGDARSQAVLGVAYEKGLGVEPDREAALKWYARAAAQGNRDAQNVLDDLEKKGLPGDGGAPGPDEGK